MPSDHPRRIEQSVLISHRREDWLLSLSFYGALALITAVIIGTMPFSFQ